MRKYLLCFFAISISIATMADNMSSATSTSDDVYSAYRAGWTFYSQGDTVSAAKCFLKAAKGGDIAAQYAYGLLKLGGLGGVKADEKAGLRMIQQAAKHGDSNALCFLGSLYESGRHGYPINSSKALHLYKQSSAEGSLNGHIACGDTYWNAADTTMAMYYWAKAVDEAKANPLILINHQRQALAQITYKLGNLHHSGNPQEIYVSRDYYEQSVEYGNKKDAAFQLGLIYLDGAYVLESDHEKATYYFSMAADAGNIEAYVFLGDLMRMSYDDAQAMFYYLSGARGGSSSAMYSLAAMYYEREDYDSALYWASQCTDNVMAVYLLGCIYYQMGDHTNARIWWEFCVFRFHSDDALLMLRSLSSGELTDHLDGFRSVRI